MLSIHMKITTPSRLSDTELVAELSRLARCEREATVSLIVHLAEFDARRLYEAPGYSSTFKYCMHVLKLSEDATYNRIRCARAARRHPEVLDMLAEGSLTPTTLRMLSKHLTREKHEELFAMARDRSRSAVAQLLAVRFPEPDVPASIRTPREPVWRAWPAHRGQHPSPLPGP